MVNYAVIGTSAITEKFIDGANSAGGLNLAAVCSRSSERGRAFAEKHGAKHVFTDLAEAARSDIEAFYIASPNSAHYKQAKLLLKHKKHVLCEKTVAKNGRLVQELCDISRENNVIFLEAIKSMFSPGAEILKTAARRAGRISQASFSFLQLSSRYPALMKGEIPNIFNPELEAGALADIGVYCLHPALYLFGECEDFHARCLRHTNGIDLCGDVLLKYPSVNVSVSYSKIANGGAPSYISGDLGTVTIEKVSELAGISFTDNSGNTEILCPYDKNFNYMRYEAEFFRSAVCEPQKHAEKIHRLNKQTIAVCSLMERIKEKCGD